MVDAQDSVWLNRKLDEYISSSKKRRAEIDAWMRLQFAISHFYGFLWNFFYLGIGLGFGYLFWGVK